MNLICMTGLTVPSKYLIELPFSHPQAEMEAQECVTYQGPSVHRVRESDLLPLRPVPGSMQLSPAANLGTILLKSYREDDDKGQTHVMSSSCYFKASCNKNRDILQKKI